MSIIKALQRYLAEYEGIDLVLTDMTHGSGSYALAPSTGGALRRDVLGNKSYLNSYQFLMKDTGRNEVDREDSYVFLESFCEWLEERVEAGVLPVLEKPYRSVFLEVSNISLWSVEEGGDATYQVQIQLTYEKENGGNDSWPI